MVIGSAIWPRWWRDCARQNAPRGRKSPMCSGGFCPSTKTFNTRASCRCWQRAFGAPHSLPRSSLRPSQLTTQCSTADWKAPLATRQDDTSRPEGDLYKVLQLNSHLYYLHYSDRSESLRFLRWAPAPLLFQLSKYCWLERTRGLSTWNEGVLKKPIPSRVFRLQLDWINLLFRSWLKIDLSVGNSACNCFDTMQSLLFTLHKGNSGLICIICCSGLQ